MPGHHRHPATPAAGGRRTAATPGGRTGGGPGRCGGVGRTGPARGHPDSGRAGAAPRRRVVAGRAAGDRVGPAAPAQPARCPPGRPGAARPRPPAARRPVSSRRRSVRRRPARPAPSIQRRPPTRRLEPGDLVCPECGEGNPTSRKFCSRCGTSLSEAQVVKAKWWRKLLPGKGPKKRKAGDRPSARKTRRSLPGKLIGIFFGGASRIVGVILLIGGILYGIVPNIRSSVNDFVSSTTHTVKNWVSPDLKQVAPIRTVANSAIKGHPGSLATDRIKNQGSYWLVKPTPQPELTVTFQSKINLKKIIVHNGPTEEVKFQNVARPKRLHLVFDNGKTADVNLDDVPDPQTQDINQGDGITSMQIFITDYYRSTISNNIALTEVEFYKEGS